MPKTFIEALTERLDESGHSLRAVAEGAGVSYEQLKRAVQRNRVKPSTTNAEDAMRVAGFFGMTLNEFVGDTLTEDRIATVALYNRLSAQERALLRAAARGLDAPDRAEGQE